MSTNVMVVATFDNSPVTFSCVALTTYCIQFSTYRPCYGTNFMSPDTSHLQYQSCVDSIRLDICKFI